MDERTDREHYVAVAASCQLLSTLAAIKMPAASDHYKETHQT